VITSIPSRLRCAGTGLSRLCWLLLIPLLAFPALAAPPRAELLPGASERDWLLIIEADGVLHDDAASLRWGGSASAAPAPRSAT